MNDISLPEDAVWSNKNTISPVDMIATVVSRSLGIIDCLDAYILGGKVAPSMEHLSATLWQLEANLKEIRKTSTIWFEEEKRQKEEGTLPALCSKIE